MCQSVPIFSSMFLQNIIWINLQLEKLSQNKKGKFFIETQCRGRPTSWYNSNGYKTLVLPFLQYDGRILWSVPSIIGNAEWNATEVCPLTLSDIRSLDFAIFRFLMKLFKTNNKDIINDCCSFFCFKLPSERIQSRKTSFDSKYYNLRGYNEMFMTQV